MVFRFLLVSYLLWSGFVAMATAADSESPPAAPPLEPLTAEAQAAVDELRQTYPADSEAIAMLDKILEGSRLGAGDGWFSKPTLQTRFTWERVQARYDADGDQAIQPAEFGEPSDFARIDCNGDEQITEADFDWSEHSLTATPGYRMFFQADRDANGKVTREEFAALYDQLNQSDDDYLAIDDLRQEFMASTAGDPASRPDRPSRSTLVLGLQSQEVGSLQPGPDLEQVAPDFTLKTLRGEPVTLSEEVGDKPIVLIFGNFTCGPFRSQSGNLEKLSRRYQDRAKFFLVYVREAHPSDGWWMMSNQRVGIEVAQPTATEERAEIASTCQQHLDLEIPFLVDKIDDRVGSMYSGMPNRLYLIDHEGRIAFKNGRGPFGFHPRQLEQALVLLLDSQRRDDAPQ